MNSWVTLPQDDMDLGNVRKIFNATFIDCLWKRGLFPFSAFL